VKNLTTPKQSEKTTERYLKDQIVKLGGFSAKWVSPNMAGVPDRICFLPNGFIVFVEIKSEGLKPTPLQEFVFKRLNMLGQPVFIVDTKEKVDALLDIIKEKINASY